MSKYLNVIFSLSLDKRKLPSDWLRAKVIPVHKTGNKHCVENYRPISITSTCCKILEHIISASLFDYLEGQNLLNPNQHGFRRKLSTITQLVETVHELAKAINDKHQVDAICLDMSKAFDRVPHIELIRKLKNFGINSTIVAWIKSYLKNRTQYVEINNAKSGILGVSSGVPQGSVLGPVLFLCYINDIAETVSSGVKVRLFADDCLLYSHITSKEDQITLSSALTSIHDWCSKWKMKINHNKTSFIRITNKIKDILPFEYEIEGHKLQKVSYFKYLGITINENLNWDRHIHSLCSAAERKMWTLRRKLGQATTTVKLTAYLTLVRPTLEYGCIVWDPYTKNQIARIEKVQRRAARFILSRYKSTDSVSGMLSELKLPQLLERRRVARLKFLYLLRGNFFNINTGLYLTKRSARTLRSSHNEQLTTLQARINTFKYSFFPRTIEEWNSLPQHITQTDSVSLFEKSIHLYFDLPN